MSGGIGEVFQRFIAAFPQGEDSKLFAEQVQIAEVTAKIPHCTVLVRGRREGVDEPLAIILMTVPSASPHDAAILDFATRRARAHKAPYFVTWTLREATLWSTPKPGLAVSRDSLEKLRDYPELYDIGPSAEQSLAEPIKLEVLARGRDILRDLDRLLTDGALQQVQIEATYFVGRLLDAVSHLLPMVSRSLHERLLSDTHLQKEMGTWATKQSIAGATDDPDFAKAVARQIIYRLLGKVLFYQSLRRVARHLPKLDLRGVDSAQVLPSLRTAFGEALKIDYHAVFAEDLPDRIQWPSDASRELASLVEALNTRDFAHLPQDVVGTVFERLIPPEDRHGLGQYFTSEDLCDLIVAFCIHSPHDTVLDPTCGTGTFLVRAYDRLRCLGEHEHSTLLSQLWGVDIAPFPAELATINLFRQHIAEHGNFPRIICQDFSKLSPGERLTFPPPKMDFDRPEAVEEPIPLFDAIIGNFPYVSADQIQRQEAGYLEHLREVLIKDWFEEYPELFFYKNRNEQQIFEKAIAACEHSRCEREKAQHHLSTYADFYVYLFFHVARFLKPGARMGIVTSNAWLDVNYGFQLQKFILRHFKLVSVLESRCEPWFVEASVNTVVTILERCESNEDRNDNLVRFVKVKRLLRELIPGDPIIQAIPRWQHLTKLVGTIEHAGLKDSKTHPLGIVTVEDDDFRIRVLRQSEMQAELENERKTVKWGRYLRAPQVYFDIIRQGNLYLLRDLSVPKRGGLTRINEFFHVTPQVAGKFGIEKEYLWPLIKSPKETNSITVDPSQLKLRIFVCRRTKAELKKLGHSGTLKYIEWGERQTYSKGTFKGLPLPEGTWVKDRIPGWWSLPESETQTSQIYYCEAYHDRHFQRYSPTPLVPDNVLCYLSPTKHVDTELLVAALNSSLAHLSLELTGRVTLGDGVLRLKVEEARDYLLVPDLSDLRAGVRREVLEKFQPLLSREAKDVFDEVKRADRRDFDSAVFRAIGLDPQKYLKSVYAGLCELVRERIDLGQKRGKARTTKARGERAEKKTIEEVLQELVPTGPKRFPDEFFSGAAALEPKVEINLPDGELIFDNRPMFMAVHVRGNSFSRHVKNPAEGKFLLFAQRAGHKVVSLPEKTVEIARTVANYEKYLRELRDQLYEAYYRRTLDDRTAARLTQSAFDRFRLPNIEP